MKAKTKTKKNGKLKYNAKDASDDVKPTCDLSSLRKPVQTNITTLRQVAKLFENGTEEIQCILDYECAVIYECKICQSLFRSLVNFISHKRVYCQEKFDFTNDESEPPVLGALQTATTNAGSKENCKNVEKQKTSSKVAKKDLTSVVHMLQMKQKNSDVEKESELRIVADTEQVLLEVIGSNTAAFQTVFEPKTEEIDKNELMKAQTTELETILNSDTAILGPDGKIVQIGSEEKFDSPLQYFNDATSYEDLICSYCDTKFSTKKTLTFHLKSLHTPNRMVYPCPCCSNQYPSTWGVYRHLVKCHRKSNSQVRRLRSDIQAKAFLTDTTRAEEIEQANAKKKSKTQSVSPTNETQEWMAHLESDGELQRCGGCGKRFDRKAALTAHFQICQRRLAACNDAAVKSKRVKPDRESPVTVTPIGKSDKTEKVEKTEKAEKTEKVEKVNNKIETTERLPALVPIKTSNNIIQMPNLSPAITISRVGSDEPAEISIRVEGVASLTKDAWDSMGSESSNATRNGPAKTSRASSPKESELSDDPEIIFTKIEKAKTPPGTGGNRKRKVCKRDSSLDSAKRGNWTSSPKINQTETPLRPVTNLDTRIANITNLRKLQCVPCKRKFTSLSNLRRHMAGHLNLYHFRCKICNYKAIDKVDFVAHCNKVHDAKNNRSSIENMMVESPRDEHAAVKPKKTPPPDLEVIDVTVSSTDTPNLITANEEIDCIIKKFGKDDASKKSASPSDGVSCSDSDDSSPNAARKAKLNEEDRRMVMRVIYGSEQPGSSIECREVVDETNSSSSSEFECSKLPAKLMDGDYKKNKKIPRAPRNRAKAEDKNFIYDLDAVVMKGIVKDPLPMMDTKSDDSSKCSSSDDLTVLLDVSEPTLAKVA